MKPIEVVHKPDAVVFIVNRKARIVHMKAKVQVIITGASWSRGKFKDNETKEDILYNNINLHVLDDLNGEGAVGQATSLIKIRDPDTEHGRLFEELGIREMTFPGEFELDMVRTTNGTKSVEVFTGIKPLNPVTIKVDEPPTPSKRSKRSNKDIATGKPSAPAS